MSFGRWLSLVILRTSAWRSKKAKEDLFVPVESLALEKVTTLLSKRLHPQTATTAD